LKRFLTNSLRELIPVPREELLARRYEKFRRMGVWLDASTSTQPVAD
jgi:hypothetical protein